MRPVELADRNLMRHQMAAAFIRKPGVKMEGGLLDPERRLAQMREVEIDGVVWRGTDCAGHTRKHRHDRAMEVAGRNKSYPRMPLDDIGKLGRIAQVLTIHVPDAGDEGRMVQEQQRRPACRR